jgi:hypothetical protein
VSTARSAACRIILVSSPAPPNNLVNAKKPSPQGTKNRGATLFRFMTKRNRRQKAFFSCNGEFPD